MSTKEDPKWADKFQEKPFDLIINTASSSAIDFASLLKTVKTEGRIISVGMPEDEIKLRVQDLAGKGAVCFLFC